MQKHPGVSAASGAERVIAASLNPAENFSAAHFFSVRPQIQTKNIHSLQYLL